MARSLKTLTDNMKFKLQENEAWFSHESNQRWLKAIYGKTFVADPVPTPGRRAYMFKHVFNGYDFSGHKLSGAKASSSSFKGSDFSNSHCYLTDFSGSDFGCQESGGTNFSNAQCQWARFRRANLRNVNFSGADLTHANFSDLEDVTGLVFDKNTILRAAIFTPSTIEKMRAAKVDVSQIPKKGLTENLYAYWRECTGSAPPPPVQDSVEAEHTNTPSPQITDAAAPEGPSEDIGLRVLQQILDAKNERRGQTTKRGFQGRTSR